MSEYRQPAFASNAEQRIRTDLERIWNKDDRAELLNALDDLMAERTGYGYTLATGRLFCDFPEFQGWASELAGRSLMTHEFADKAVWDELRQAFETEMTERHV